MDFNILYTTLVPSCSICGHEFRDGFALLCDFSLRCWLVHCHFKGPTGKRPWHRFWSECSALEIYRTVQTHTKTYTHTCMHAHTPRYMHRCTDTHKRTHTHLTIVPIFCLLAVYLLFVFIASVTCSDVCCYPLFTWMEYITLPQLGTKDAEIRSPVLKTQSCKWFPPFSLQ